MNKITLRLICIFVCFCSIPSFAQSVVINEVLASNTSVNADQDGDFEDWVELFNPGTTSVNLAGFGLSDDDAEPFKWTFPNISIAAGQYIIVWCSDKNLVNPALALHTNFKISAAGETISLTNPAAALVDQSPAVAMASNVSWGRLPNGTGGFVFFESPTPAAVNSTTGNSGQLALPVFSHTAGFYTSAFELSLSATDPGATVIYTLDGSEPESSNLGGTTYTYKNSYEELAGQPTGELLENSFQTLSYAGPISIIDRSTLPDKLAMMSSTQHFAPVYFPEQPIFKGTVVRAKAVKPGAIDSPTVTMTYFVTGNGSAEFSFPMVCSVSINEDSLFEYNDGIYTAGKDFDDWRIENPSVNTTPYNFDGNFHRKGDWSEREGHIEMFLNGTQIVNQDIGIRLSGDSSRAWPSKSMKLIARPEFGNDSFQFQFFPDAPVTTFNRLLLRNSGNDFRRTMYRDALAQRLVKGLLEIQAYRPTITFLNGEYWGILNLRERYDKYYFKNVHGIDQDQLDMLENDFTAEEGDATHYENLESYLTANSLSSQDNFNFVATQIDPDDFRDYFITNIFLSNTDWPGWNNLFWRKKTDAFTPNGPEAHDGRWRTAMKDADAAFGLGVSVNDHNTLAMATASNGPSYPNPPRSTLLLRSLLENSGFETGFINRFADLLNTYFKSDRIIGMSTEMKNTLLPEIERHIDRWKAVELVWWNIHINNIHAFADQRPEIQRSHLREKFGISQNITATLDVSDQDHGHIKINTIDILPSTPGVDTNPYPWTGIYFSDIPVTLKAIAKPGYAFSHWEGASTSSNSEITITSATGFDLTAVFVPDASPLQDTPIYFWMIDNSIANDIPLQTLESTFEVTPAQAVLEFESCLAGYPFSPSHENWRKASMERRNNPTVTNYIPSANGGLSFEQSDMKGLQIRQPFENGGLQNKLVFNVPTGGFKDIKFSFAAVDEGAATGISVDYSTGAETQWTSAGINGEFSLTQDYQLFEVDLSTIAAANNNPNLRIRVGFTGPSLAEDNGARVTFNNIALIGDVISLSSPAFETPELIVHPNPFTDLVNVLGADGAGYKIFTLDGREVATGIVGTDHKINLAYLSSGMYLLQLTYDGITLTRKILKR